MHPNPDRKASSRFLGHDNRVQSHRRRIREHLRKHPEDQSRNDRTDTGDTQNARQTTTPD